MFFVSTVLIAESPRPVAALEAANCLEAGLPIALKPKTLTPRQCLDTSRSSGSRLNALMPSSRSSERTLTGRRTRAVLTGAMRDLERLRLDAGISLRRLAHAAQIDPGYLTRVIAGDRQPSIAVLVALARALGADLSIRAFSNTGPQIHDRAQAPIVEELVRIADPSWRRSVEVPVFRPARGFIDLVLDRSHPPDVIATEVQTRLDRLEQLIRWSQEKARSLPSSNLWASVPGDPAVARLLVLRSTAATREIARRFEGTLAAAYPMRSADMYAAVTEPARPWPGDGILWADLRAEAVRILDRPPRGVALGR
jgi:transcriptional regulator with XRE-family HTH domain